MTSIKSNAPTKTRTLTLLEIENVSGGLAVPANGSVCKYPAGPNGEPGCGTVPKHPVLPDVKS